MVFAEDYFEGEERGGFYIQPMMKRAWAAQIEILKEIDDICKRHHIKYFAWFGTLLGAVRHNGFIPWDDDMDLAMLRGDYERFRHYAGTELPKGWYVSATQPTIIRVMNSDTVRTDQEFLDKFHGCPYMVGVDIFCLDSIPKNKEDEKIAVDLFWGIAYLAAHWDYFGESDQKVWEAAREEGVRNIERITGCHFNWEYPIKEQLAFLADKIISMYWDEDFDEATRIFKLHENPDYRLPRSWFDEIIEIPFENRTVPVLKSYDSILRKNYGKDYMTPLMGGSHSYPFFKSQMSMLQDIFEKQGKALPECFMWEDV